jgi:hypothetical protein
VVWRSLVHSRARRDERTGKKPQQVLPLRFVNKLFALYQGTTFSRATTGQNGQGFSPCHRKICTKFQDKKAPGLKSLRENLVRSPEFGGSPLL